MILTPAQAFAQVYYFLTSFTPVNLPTDLKNVLKEQYSFFKRKSISELNVKFTRFPFFADAV